MKVLTKYIGGSYPYKLADFMYGKVDFGDLIQIEEGNDPDQIDKEVFAKLLAEAKQKAHVIVCNIGSDDLPKRELSETSGRRRRF